jgi:hypothetical protein
MELEKKHCFKKNILLYFGCLIVAFAFMLVCSSNSFLYSLNDGQDLNNFLIVGSGILSGKVPYRDLSGQKGPIVYYICAFFKLFPNPYIAVFVFEVICASLYLFMLAKLFQRYVSGYLSIIGAVFIGLVTYILLFFCAGGGSVEEFVLPIYVWFLIIFKDFLDGKTFGVWRSISVGIMMWILVFSKFALALIPLVTLVVWFVVGLCRKQFKKTFGGLALMLSIFLILSAGVCLLFYLQNSLVEFVKVYFYNNVVLYGGGTKIYSLVWSKVVSSPLVFFVSVVVATLALSVFVILLAKKRNVALFLIPLIFQVALFICMEKVCLYNFLILIPYISFLLIFLFRGLDKTKVNAFVKTVLVIISVAVCVGLPFVIFKVI